MPRQSKADLVRECREIVRGINSELAAVAALDIAGASYTRAQLIAVFQGMIDAAQKTKGADAAYQVALAQERKMRPRVRVVRNAFKSFLQGRYGKSSPKLALFGIEEAAPATPKLAVKVAAAEKRRATRKARNTMGPKQKQKIKGVLPDDVKKTKP